MMLSFEPGLKFAHHPPHRAQQCMVHLLALALAVHELEEHRAHARRDGRRPCDGVAPQDEPEVVHRAEAVRLNVDAVRVVEEVQVDICFETNGFESTVLSTFNQLKHKRFQQGGQADVFKLAQKHRPYHVHENVANHLHRLGVVLPPAVQLREERLALHLIDRRCDLHEVLGVGVQRAPS